MEAGIQDSDEKTPHISRWGEKKKYLATLENMSCLSRSLVASKWQPTAVCLPKEFRGQRTLEDYS